MDSSRKRFLTAFVRVTVANTLVWGVLGAGATAALASWVGENCRDGSDRLEIYMRTDAREYAMPARNEGYEWNGGCYKLNDRDDTAGAPVDSGGEGADCSGFVFKTWGLKKDGSPGFRHWDHQMDIHGPYSTWQYIDPAPGDQFHTISKSYVSTGIMDAFVYRLSDEGHITMIHHEGADGWDYVIHARNNTVGTLLEQMDYRSWSSTEALQREDWTPECFPHCS